MKRGLHSDDQIDAFIKAVSVIVLQFCKGLFAIFRTVHHAEMFVIERLPGAPVQYHEIRSDRSIASQIQPRQLFPVSGCLADASFWIIVVIVLIVVLVLRIVL